MPTDFSHSVKNGRWVPMVPKGCAVEQPQPRRELLRGGLRSDGDFVICSTSIQLRFAHIVLFRYLNAR